MEQQIPIIEALYKLAALCPAGRETIVIDGNNEPWMIDNLIDEIKNNVDGLPDGEEYARIMVEEYAVDGPATPFGRCGQIVRMKSDGYRENLPEYRVKSE